MSTDITASIAEQKRNGTSGQFGSKKTTPPSAALTAAKDIEQAQRDFMATGIVRQPLIDHAADIESATAVSECLDEYVAQHPGFTGEDKREFLLSPPESLAEVDYADADVNYFESEGDEDRREAAMIVSTSLQSYRGGLLLDATRLRAGDEIDLEDIEGEGAVGIVVEAGAGAVEDDDVFITYVTPDGEQKYGRYPIGTVVPTTGFDVDGEAQRPSRALRALREKGLAPAVDPRPVSDVLSEFALSRPEVSAGWVRPEKRREP